MKEFKILETNFRHSGKYLFDKAGSFNKRDIPFLHISDALGVLEGRTRNKGNISRVYTRDPPRDNGILCLLIQSFGFSLVVEKVTF